MKKSIILFVICVFCISVVTLSAGPQVKRTALQAKAPIKTLHFLPDLKIIKVQKVPSDVRKLKVTILNNGFKASGKCYLRLKTFYGPGKFHTTHLLFQPLGSKSLKRNQFRVLNFRTVIIKAPIPLYSTLNHLTIDAYNAVKEYNEGNNLFIADYLIK